MKTKKILVIFILLLLPVITQAQCAMCRAVLESEADSGAAEAINDGITYLMLFPYLLVGGVGFFIWRLMKKKPAV